MAEPSSSAPIARWSLLVGCLSLLLCIGALLALATGGYYFHDQTWPQQIPTTITLAPTAAAPTDAALAAAPPTAVATAPPPRNPLALQPTTTRAVQEVIKPTLALNPPPEIVQQPVSPLHYERLQRLLATEYPVHDFYEAARRLSPYEVGPRTVTSSPYRVGDRQTFRVEDVSTGAILVAVTDHTYFWVDEALSLDQTAVQQAAETFEYTYYPRLVQLFGQEWQPGVDNDPHFSVLHLADLQSSTDELGFFNSGDEYPRSFYSVSNQQEIIYLHMGNLTLGSDLYYGTLVHEFEHLVQWYIDGNESTWLDEGLAQLAELYVGLDTADPSDYLLAPGTRLNTWNYSTDDVYAHYSAAYLFLTYLWEQLGDEAIRELARHPANGLAAVDAVLRGYRPDATLEQFIREWVAANYLDDEAAGAAFHYDSFELRPAVTEAGVRYTPFETVRDLEQFSTHYVELDVATTATVSFAGDTLSPLLPIAPYSGDTMWFAPAQENVNAHLTAHFDLSEAPAATLTFWAWYDLQFDLDYAYITASTDGGQSWELLSPANSRAAEYGPALNGRSADVAGAGKGGWMQETISLDKYVGRQLLLRFELLTYYEDGAHGLALDDIAIPELDYYNDLETDAGGWEGAGFVRTGQWLPQQWQIQFIRPGSKPEVRPLPLDSLNQGQWTLPASTEGDVLAITALTPFVEEPASYWLYVGEIGD